MAGVSPALKSVSVPAGVVGVSVSAVIPRIMVDVSVPGIEAVMACPSASVAPVPVTRLGADVLGARHKNRPKICCA
jgi:hypothetical protein